MMKWMVYLNRVWLVRKHKEIRLVLVEIVWKAEFAIGFKMGNMMFLVRNCRIFSSSQLTRGGRNRELRILNLRYRTSRPPLLTTRWYLQAPCLNYQPFLLYFSVRRPVFNGIVWMNNFRMLNHSKPSKSTKALRHNNAAEPCIRNCQVLAFKAPRDASKIQICCLMKSEEFKLHFKDLKNFM